MITTNWTDILDELVCEAITAGRVHGELQGSPDEIFESGLAHIFFYGETVYKLYKTHADKDHFIKGVLAPTKRRVDFLQHDFTLNQHFSQEVYRKLHSVWYRSGVVEVTQFNPASIYTLVEMSRLDFDHNLHERLLRKEISQTELEELGYEIARAVDTCPITPPAEVNWYELAAKRIDFLELFVGWLPDEFGVPLGESGVIAKLRAHLERHREEYITLSGEQLTVNIDNHDENVFFINGQVQFIDLLPPMESWWYGVPYANLANVMANVEALLSEEAAGVVWEGYVRYFSVAPPAHTFGFVRAFAHLISIAHFGSVPGKEAVTRCYMRRLDDIPGWL